MLNFQYLEDTNNYQVSFEKLNKNHAKILGDIPLKTNGFILTRIDEPEAFTGDYSDYTTVYKEIDGGVIFSNDGSTYTEPTVQGHTPTLKERVAVVEGDIAKINTALGGA